MIDMFREVPRTGVIYVTTEAQKKGFHVGHPDWCNLGQGQPETDALPGAPPRVLRMDIRPDDQDYAPVPGLWELREAVANLYNQMYRKGLPSQYGPQNVAICGGGRVGLMRACAAISPVHMGHFLPDYTAYAELLDVFRRFSPIPILLDPEQQYAFTVDQLRREIEGRGLGALLVSNPSNPTGKVVRGNELKGWVDTSRELGCALMLDEFYSHYIWPTTEHPNPQPISAAAHVQDVEQDPVVIVDGLTKNWRYPGWRVAWVLGPSHVIDAVSSAGSFMDGGGVRPIQRAAIDLVNIDHVRAESTAIRNAFLPKRDRLIHGLQELGIEVELETQGSFYVWGNLCKLPEGLRDGEALFRAALEEKVICVPGVFFDVDPGQRRSGRPSRFQHHARFSFGPEMEVIEKALARLKAVIR